MAKPMNDAQSRRDFVRRNHTCVASYARKTAPPSMSIVHYAMDGDDIVFLTMAERQKAKAAQRLGQMSACILAGEQGGLSWPPEYLVVDGKARLCTDMDDVIKVAAKIIPIMTGKPLPEEALPGVRKVMEQERRVVIRITPESTFHSPSVHNVEDADPDSDQPLHGLGARISWRDA
jgi:nitroimidazol reductase NimA-like FMN-containing flavoprotein (pyridoxamine 5'-phosphate oxidase superfamily)